MALRFWKILTGLNVVPKTPTTGSEMGDIEVDSATGKIMYHDGSSSEGILTENTPINLGANGIQFKETGGGSNVITVQAPASVGSDFTLKLPPDTGTVDYILRTDGSGSTSWVPPTIDVTPTGVVNMYAGTSAPSGWKLCDGSQYDPALEPTLFAVISTIYNTGGETPGWFRVPDMRGRIAPGKDDMGGTPANRVTAGGSGITGTTLGSTGGSQNHTLTSTEMPSHTHTQDTHLHGTGTLVNGSSTVSGTITASASAVTGTAAADGNHSHGGNTGLTDTDHLHSYPASAEGGGSGGNGSSSNAFGSTTAASGNGYILNAPTNGGSAGAVNSSASSPGSDHSHTISASGTHTHSVSGTADAQSIGHSLTAAAQAISGSTALTVATNQNTGGGGAHLNMQPSLILNYIIKA